MQKPKDWRWGILLGTKNGNVRASGCGEARHNRSACALRVVAIATQVPENDMREIFRDKLGNKFSG
jgi:hypothetical protein